jgi:hypothetical protein
MYLIVICFILKVRNKEAIRMDMNHLFLEYMWDVKKEEMKKEANFKETYKLYPEFTTIKRIFKGKQE